MNDFVSRMRFRLFAMGLAAMAKLSTPTVAQPPVAPHEVKNNFETAFAVPKQEAWTAQDTRFYSCAKRVANAALTFEQYKQANTQLRVLTETEAFSVYAHDLKQAVMQQCN